MAQWVIRRKADGLYVQRGIPERFGPLETAGVFANENRGRGSACIQDGEEWVELGADGQPVEAKAPGRMWVVRRIRDGHYYTANASVAWVDSPDKALRYDETHADPRDDREWVPVLVHPDGTVTLDEPAPAVPAKPERPCPRCVGNPHKHFASIYVFAEGPHAGKCISCRGSGTDASAQPSPYSDSADKPIPYRIATPTPDEPIPVTTAELITAECDAIAKMLLAKNAAYGDSALSPVRVFSRADSVEQIKVRIDDKLSRLARGSGTETEDVVSDLLGYLVLLRIAQRKAAT